MNREIERKFLVCADFMPYVISSERIVQGYLSLDPERTVRIRIKGDKGSLTIKGASSDSGISRLEWETEIPVLEAEQLMPLCLKGAIDKIRYIVPANNGKVFEVDVFAGENEGLIVAEIELECEDEVFEKPHWLGQEVTGDKKYYNSSLIKIPFKDWSK